jgi:hypothetical protein
VTLQLLHHEYLEQHPEGLSSSASQTEPERERLPGVSD